jgi:hypothetical protein
MELLYQVCGIGECALQSVFNANVEHCPSLMHQCL